MTSLSEIIPPLEPTILNSPDGEPHPDCEEAVYRQRHRTANELGPVRSPIAPQSSQARSNSPNAPPGSSISTVRPRTGRSSVISTAPDPEGPGLRRQSPRWYDQLTKAWTSQISVTIDEGSHRDHLGYLRTSLMLAMTGVIVAQLFRLQHTVNPHPELGFYKLGTPLAATFIAFGIFVLLIGAFRFWKQQNAMIRGKVHSGGWEISTIMLLSILLFLAFFILVVAIDIDRSYNR